jgi:ADP-heptose:LPS heptosyltransferase
MLLATRASSTKRYPHWSAVVALLKQSWPELVLVQIGAGTSTAIEGVDICLIDQTSLQQTVEIIRGAALHLDHESGLVHLARCLGVKSCVVFGPTSADYFGYEGNINLRPRICGGCWWIKATWMDQCPRGFAEPICTHSTPPTDVVAAILAVCRPGAPASGARIVSAPG